MRLIVLTAATLPVVCAQSADCNAPAPSASLVIPVPVKPFAVAVTSDGCWLFVSGEDAVVVLQRHSGHVDVARRVSLPAAGAAGLALTHDGRLLVVTAGRQVDFLDAGRLISGASEPFLGSFSAGSQAGSVYAAITADDRLLFVSDEGQQSLTVVDLERSRANGYKDAAIVGRVPVGNGPVGLAFSPDGKWLYSTSETGPPQWNWPRTCGGPTEGAVIVVDVARTAKDPAHSVAARVPSGCSPVRVAPSPDGTRLYVTARGSYSLVVFDAAKLRSDAQHARLAMFYVGPAPVPVIAVDGGRRVVVGNSNRFAGGQEPETLAVIDASRVNDGEAAVIGSVPTGAFPREMALAPDGRTLFLTNFTSKTLQVIDVARLPR